MSMKYDSKELRQGEVFVGNTNANGGHLPQHLARLNTARIGEQAFDIHGEKLDRNYMRPLFIGSADLAEYDRIMCNLGRRMKKKLDKYLKVYICV